MVSTRSHPSAFPPPDSSPTKSWSSSTSTPEPTSPSKRGSPSKSLRPQSTTTRKPAKRASRTWAHTPSHAILLWLTISLPLVAWDTLYIFLRPYSMPGGSLHSPIWTPYAIYARVDLVYGFPALEESDGFTAAQASMNVVESAVYLAYLWVVGRWGAEENEAGRGMWGRSWWGRARTVGGMQAGAASLLGFSGALMTFSKTLLYALNEYCSNFKHTRHNSLYDITFYYIIPNGAWLVFSLYMTYVFGAEILQGLAVATGEDVSESKVLALKDE